MKSKTILLGLFGICLIANSSCAQEPKEVKSVKKEIRKEVRMEEENGVKTLTISTDENGVKTEEVYVGAEAEQKMAELSPEINLSSNEENIEEHVEERVEVRINEKTNERTVTIKKSINGEETIEVFEGVEADEKIKELESESGNEMIIEEKKVVRKTEKRSRKMKSIE